MNPIDPFHSSGELLFQLLMAVAELLLEATGYGGTPEGVVGMIFMAGAILLVVS